jgi:RNA polymerase sigma-70 factor (ECF subfamily)
MNYLKIDNNKMNPIIKGCLNNDRRAQKMLFDEYAGRLMAISYRYMGNEEEANEVLQEGFIKIFDKLTTYNPSSETFNIFYWMKRVVINTALDKLRQRKQKRILILSDQDNIFQTTNHDEMYDFESVDRDILTADVLIKAVAKLSPMYRVVFNLHVVEEFTHAEIADKLGINEGTSKSNLFKAKAKLRKLLENKLELINQ